MSSEPGPTVLSFPKLAIHFAHATDSNLRLCILIVTTVGRIFSMSCYVRVKRWSAF